MACACETGDVNRLTRQLPNGSIRNGKGTKPVIIRQGDVLLRRVGDVDAVPAKARKVKRDDAGRVVLALGESTGHAHALLDREVDLYEVGTTADAVERFLRVNTKAATLVHDEHTALTIPQGVYAVTIQREYAPEISRMVMD